MLRHNLLLIFRNIRRFRGMFLINLIGLPSGLACTLLVHDELQVDYFFDNDRQLYQVVQNIPDEQGTTTVDLTPLPLGKALSDEIPEVESQSRQFLQRTTVVTTF